VSLATVLKDPAETLLATMDWSGKLAAGVTISTAAWVLPPGLSEVSSAIIGQTTTILVSGGTPGEDYLCRCTITTSDSQTIPRSGPLKVRDL